MATCNIQNRNGEPRPFYQTPLGTFRSMKEALSTLQEGQTMTVGFINTEDVFEAQTPIEFAEAQNEAVIFNEEVRVADSAFIPAVETPVTFNPSTREGIVYSSIRDGLIQEQSHRTSEGHIVLQAEGQSELQAGINAEDFATELQANSEPHGYERRGNTFILTDTYGKTFFGGKYYTQEELNDPNTKDPALQYLQERTRIQQKADQVQLAPQETTDTHSGLESLLVNFLQSIGVSLVSIEQYKQKHALRHGVHPDANALADIANKIVAIRNGKATVEELTEEAVHFIIEGWNQSEIERLLNNIHHTKEWAEHSDAYFAMYDKQYNNPAQLDQMVRREVLGKFVANRLRAPQETRTEQEQNIFGYFLRMLQELFERFRTSITEKHTRELQDFSARINTLLRNEQLQEFVSEGNLQKSNMLPMYAIDKSSPFYKLHGDTLKALKKINQNLNVLQELSDTPGDFKQKLKSVGKSVEQMENTQNEEQLQQTRLSIIGLFGVFDTKARELEQLLNALPEDSPIPNQYSQVYYILRNEMLPVLQAVQNTAYRKRVELEDMDGNLQRIMDEAFSRYNRVAGEIEGRERYDVRNSILEDVRRRGGEESVEVAEELLDKEHSDISWFWKMFGQMKDSKFPLAAKLGKLVLDMTSKIRENYLQEVTPFLRKLQDRAKDLPKLAKEGYFWSHRNYREIEKRTALARARAFKEVLNLQEPVEKLAEDIISEKSIEEYITENKLQVDPNDIIRKFNRKADQYLFESGIIDKNSDRYKRRAQFFKLIEKLNISDETYEIIRNQASDKARIQEKMGGVDADPLDPINASYQKKLDEIKTSRSNYKDVFQPSAGRTNATSLLKEGLTLVSSEGYDPFDPNQVRINNNIVVEIDRANASTEAIIAFELNRFDRDSIVRREQAEQLQAQGKPTKETGWELQNGKWVDTQSMFTPGDTSRLKSELRQMYNRQYDLAVQEGKNPAQAQEIANRKTFEFFQRIGNLGFTQDFYSDSSMQSPLMEALRARGDAASSHYSLLIQQYRGRISLVLKKYQQSYDFREVDGTRISVEDKVLIEDLQDRIRETTKQAIEYLGDDFNIEEVESENATERRPNQSFYGLYYDHYRVDYSTDTNTSRKRKFLESQVSPESIETANKFEDALDRYLETGTLNDTWMSVLSNLGLEVPTNLEEARQAGLTYLESKLPPYFMRFAPAQYESILNQMRTNMNGLLNTPNSIIDRILNGEEPHFEFNITQATQEERGIRYPQSFRLYQEKRAQAEQETTEGKRLLRAYESFFHILGQDESTFDPSTIDSTFLENFGMSIDSQGNLTEPTRNLEQFDSLVTLLDMRASSLEKHKEIGKTNVFRMPRYPKKNLERISADPVTGIKYAIKDLIRYREDEEDSFVRSEARRIPKIGFSSRLPLEDTSTDLLMVAMLDMYNAEIYKQRTETITRAFAIRDSIENIKIKGKNTKDSDLWEMVNGYMDNAFFGRQTSWKGTVDILGKKVDISKVLIVFRNFIQTNALGFSVPVAITSMTTAGTNKAIQRFVKYHMYAPANNRANAEWAKLIGGSIKDMGKVYTESKLELLMQYFGNYDLTQRTTNAAYNYGIRNISDVNSLAFSIHQMANAPIIPRVMLSKLMEYRFIDGKFLSWGNYLTIRKAQDPTLRKRDIQAEFEQYSEQNLYDYIDIKNGQLWSPELQKLEFKNTDGTVMNSKQAQEYIQQMFLDVRADIMNNVSQYDGIIDSSQKTGAQRHPLFAFATVFRSWITIASTRNFSPKRINFDTGNIEEGIMVTLFGGLNNALKKAIKNKENPMIAIREMYSNLTPAQIANLRTFGFTLGTISVFIGMTALLIGWSDDDEEDYALALASYMSSRLLNETFNSSFGLFSEYYSFLDNPISATSTIQSVFNLANISNISEEVKRGPYAGWNKYSANAFKMTFLKNFYGISSTENVLQTRRGYEYFNSQAMISPFVLTKFLNEEEEED